MDKYGLIGYPLGHSFSKNYFNEKFENEGIDAQYINFEIPSIENLTEILDSNPELKGLNVTIPYKEKVISYLDVVSPEANAIGAVNVIKVEHRGEDVYLKGYNSDVIGFTKSIEPYIEPYHKKALILGTGGASKAINFGLKSLGLETALHSEYALSPVAFRRRLLRRQPKPDIQPHFSPIKCGAQSEFIGMKIITSIIT